MWHPSLRAFAGSGYFRGISSPAAVAVTSCHLPSATHPLYLEKKRSKDATNNIGDRKQPRFDSSINRQGYSAIVKHLHDNTPTRTPRMNLEAGFLGKCDGRCKSAERCVYRKGSPRDILPKATILCLFLCVPPPWVWRNSARKIRPSERGGVLSHHPCDTIQT